MSTSSATRSPQHAVSPRRLQYRMLTFAIDGKDVPFRGLHTISYTELTSMPQRSRPHAVFAARKGDSEINIPILS